MNSITDIEFAELERIANASIHELVFALKHLEDDNAVDAQNCLTTVGLNIDRMQDMILAAERRAPEISPSLPSDGKEAA